MSADRTFAPVVQFFPGVSVVSYRGEDDNAKVIQIDTENDERIRVNLNDAPVFDGSPEKDEPLGVTRIERRVVGVTLKQLERLEQAVHDDRVTPGEPIWVQLPADEKLRRMNQMRVPLEIAGIVVEK